MAMLKRTYALPQDTLEEFERATPAGKRSALIAELVRSWLEHEKRERLRREVIEGCREMTDVYLEIEREYHPLEEEVQHALDDESPPRGRGARTTRSRRRV
jgi:metal-responsive CopG/Arc/MetJ family transcriptional regulator